MERLMLIAFWVVWTKNKNAGSNDKADKDLISLLQNGCLCAGFVRRDGDNMLAVTTTRPAVLAALNAIEQNMRTVDPQAQLMVCDVNPA